MAEFRLPLTGSNSQTDREDINYLEMYNASEGFFAAQVTGDDGMLLLRSWHFYGIHARGRIWESRSRNHRT